MRREQVGRELDAPEGAAEASRDRLGEDGLARTGNILDQQVTAAQEGNQREPDLVVLAHDDPLNIGDHAVAGLLDLRHRVSSQGWDPSRGNGTPGASIVAGNTGGPCRVVN